MAPKNVLQSKKVPKNLLESFNIFKRSGNLRRKINKRSMEIMNVRKSVNVTQNRCVLLANREVVNTYSVNNIRDAESLNLRELNEESNEEPNGEIADTSEKDWLVESDSESSEENLLGVENTFRTKLTEWALNTNPTQHQLRELLKLCNESLPFKLPQDPRTILSTPRCINLSTFEDGSQYWHHGLIEPLKSVMQTVTSLPDKLSLNINVDGLPIYESSREEFWPILFNIHELKHIDPVVVGIYRGIGT